MDDDILRELRAADPARRVDLGRVDPRALDALRKEILVTSTEPETGRRTVRRLSRRTVTAGAAVLALLGGGAAYAGAEHGWYVGGGGAYGITCVTHWVDPTKEVPDSTGGPALTVDPVADCQRYQALSDRPPIEDGVAFRYGPQIYVAPRDQLPAGATIITPATQDEAVYELSQSIQDMVDGLRVSCRSSDDEVAAARAELARLGLTDWEVRTREAPAGIETFPCAGTSLGQDLGLTDRTLIVTADVREDLDSLNGNGIDPFVFELRDALRTGIADRCVDVSEAEAVAAQAVGAAHHWPTTVIVDADATCTRVDMEVGGSIQITLRGPEKVGP